MPGEPGLQPETWLETAFSCFGYLENGGVAKFLYNYSEGWIFSQTSRGNKFWVVGTEDPPVCRNLPAP